MTLAVRLPATMPKKLESVYPSAMWHHDRCGRRLKAFVFLHDVDEHTHPTRIAVGSHETLYWSHNLVATSRFSSSFVRRNYRTVPMVGKMGEGFIFDTNTIHSATVTGNRSREALVIEFNPAEKARLLDRSPCGFVRGTVASRGVRKEHQRVKQALAL